LIRPDILAIGEEFGWGDIVSDIEFVILRAVVDMYYCFAAHTPLAIKSIKFHSGIAICVGLLLVS
jgi:hypothetical protein